MEGREIRQPVTDHPRDQSILQGRPRLLVSAGEHPSGGSDEGQGMQRSYEITTPVTMLGRGTDCDLRLVDAGVSRHHAEIRVEGNEVVVVDLESTNGTFVNGQPIKRAMLVNGTRVSLGRTTLIFQRD